MKILLLMTLISISVSLKTLNILEYESERRGWKNNLKDVIAQLLYIMIFIIMNLKFKFNSAEISQNQKL